MALGAPVRSAKGISTSASVSPSFAAAPAAGNLIVLGIAADDYNVSPEPGWHQEAEMEQQTFHGGYLWWRKSNGGNSFSYSIGSATNSAWVMAEFADVEANAQAFDGAQGRFTQTSTNSILSDSLVPSLGERLMVAMFGASFGGDASAMVASFTNSFTKIDQIGNSGGVTRDMCSLAYRVVTGNGVTGYTTTGSHGGIASDSQSILVAAFREESAAYSPPDWPRRLWRL